MYSDSISRCHDDFLHLLMRIKWNKMNLLQNLIHESLVATGHVECAAIIRRKDSSIRATSVGYTVSILICWTSP